MIDLKLDSDDCQAIISWAQSRLNELTAEEVGEDFWEVWRSADLTKAYDVNIWSPNVVTNIARVVAHNIYIDENNYEITEYSRFVYLGDVNIPQQIERVIMDKEELILKIIEILQTDGEEMNDGECLDEVAVLLEKQGYTVFNKEEK